MSNTFQQLSKRVNSYLTTTMSDTAVFAMPFQIQLA